jgi:hypothetical protein
METPLQLDRLRQQTRAAQHATSYPLLVIGVLFLNYGVVGFTSQPIAWRYAGALAFVALWALGKANEYATGVGRRSDYLAIAGGVGAQTLVAWGAATCAGGIALGIERFPAWEFQGVAPFAGGELHQQARYVVILGVVLTVAGFVVFLRERRLS